MPVAVLNQSVKLHFEKSCICQKSTQSANGPKRYGALQARESRDHRESSPYSSGSIADNHGSWSGNVRGPWASCDAANSCGRRLCLEQRDAGHDDARNVRTSRRNTAWTRCTTDRGWLGFAPCQAVSSACQCRGATGTESRDVYARGHPYLAASHGAGSPRYIVD